MQREWVRNTEKHANGFISSQMNRFIILVFGDLKNYKFSMRSVILEQ